MLAVGSIAIVGYNSDNNDSFSFLVLGPIPKDEVILFTDNGVTDTGGFRDNEGVLSWTAPEDVVPGTVVTFTVGAENPDCAHF